MSSHQQLTGPKYLGFLGTSTHFLNRVSNNVTSGNNFTGLTHPVYPIQRLLFGHGVPLWFHEMNAACCSKVQAVMINSQLSYLPLASWSGNVKLELTLRQRFRWKQVESYNLGLYGKLREPLAVVCLTLLRRSFGKQSRLMQGMCLSNLASWSSK